ncbi:glycosyltransferase [Sphaerospermopsis sp. FACHB-1094]|uniref:glycosyltransferase n=1 Tax=Sphaerospermopsis sp. FACHB-1094 TaxID=2692861 RepID=UPI001683D6B8|nr:glycosyltransferase [Sphaerospermopsis sp. FACHB-1094]MBD2133742.1 glycosyltransferase [Sphaerospermopsis sp. FACHB-1094]
MNHYLLELLNFNFTESRNTANSKNNFVENSQNQPKLFCIAHDLPPLKTPIANRANKILSEIQKTWQIHVLTGTNGSFLSEKSNICHVKSWYPQALITWLGKLKLEKILTLLVWPDPEIFWFLPALFKGYQLIKQQKPDAIFVIMMPYSAGLLGVALKFLTGLPLVVSLDDSLSCTDMHPYAVSWLHHYLERWLENFYVRQANAVVYVSQFNLELVKIRQPEAQKSKFHLIRCGADPLDFTTPINSKNDNFSFDIVYTGGMNGWYEFYHRPQEKTLPKKLYKAWLEWGYYQRAKIDHRSSSPVFVGEAIKEVISQNPAWKNKIKLSVYGNSFPEFVIDKVLENQNITDVVNVSGALPHFQAIQLARQADLLLITLPNRPDGTPGGRISCKTYEYLMTDRPILAAVPYGENWNYLQDKPGVWLVEPTDVKAIKEVIIHIATAKFSGSPLQFDRSYLHKELSYQNLVQDYLKIFDAVCSTSTFNHPL